MKFPDAHAPFRPSRRRFVQGLALGGVAAGFGFARLPAFATDSSRLDAKRAELTGRDFDLSIGEMPVNFTGATRRATAVNGQLPGAAAALARRATRSRCACATGCRYAARSIGTASCCRRTWTACPA